MGANSRDPNFGGGGDLRWHEKHLKDLQEISIMHQDAVD